MNEPTTFEEYLATVPEDRRAPLESLRATIRASAPEATETIAYDMPAFRSRGGRFLVSFAAYKNHYSLFPASDGVVKGLGDALTPYLAGKGTIRFPAGKPIPLDLVTRIVTIRVAENEDRKAR
jgi:uncharacterized protein YdhG (YjbR/CyaY superfamily)